MSCHVSSHRDVVSLVTSMCAQGQGGRGQKPFPAGALWHPDVVLALELFLAMAATALQPAARAALMTNGPKGRTRESSINPHLAFTHRFEQQLPWAADRAAVPGDSDTPELQDSHSTHQPSTDGVLSLSCPRGHF